jgi:hypothetical protein
MRKLVLATPIVLVSLAAVGACTSGSGLVGGGLGDGGGDGSTGYGHINRTPFPSTCSLGLAGLTPTGAFDAMEIRVTLAPDADAGGGLPYTVQETRGTPCSTAANNATCITSFHNAVVAMSAWSTNANYSGGAAPPPARYAFYVVTHGDTVVTISNAADLVAFLAPIDSVTEAIDVKQGPLGGTSVCPYIRTDADGYSFLEDGCGSVSGSNPGLTENVIKVSRTGAVSTVQTAGPFPDPTGSCLPKP